MAENLAPFLGRDEAEAWLKNIELDRAVIQWNRVSAELDSSKNLKSRVEAYQSASEAIKSHMPGYLYRTDFLQRLMAAQPFIREYLAQGHILDTMMDSQPAETLKLASAHFGGAAYGGDAQSPYTLAEAALDKFTAQLYRSPAGNEDFMVSLRRKALLFRRYRLASLAAGQIDDLWRSEVTGAVRFLNEEDTNKALYGPDGLLVKFQKDHLGPFVEAEGSGFKARSWAGLEFPLTQDFLNLLDAGSRTAEPIADSYPVTVSAVASLVDSQALEKPERTSLTLKSPDSVQTLDIYNYPVSRTFTWKPASGGDAELAVFLPSLELYVRYSGPYAFPALLKDILKGELVYHPSDFPDHEQQLNALGITGIRIMIQADGALPAIRLLDIRPLPLPASIIKVP
jgi:hypothetical protein